MLRSIISKVDENKENIQVITERDQKVLDRVDNLCANGVKEFSIEGDRIYAKCN